MLAHTCLAGGDPRRFAGVLAIERVPIPRPHLPHLAAYRDAFLARAGGV
jgi:hypothetical protein